MLLNVRPSSVHVNPDAVYVLTGATTQAAVHPVVVPSKEDAASAAPINILLFLMTFSS
jgi:hypothetical protein